MRGERREEKKKMSGAHVCWGFFVYVLSRACVCVNFLDHGLLCFELDCVTLAITLSPEVMNDEFCKPVLVEICREQIKSIVPKIEEMKVPN
jgi:hypothetical protein